MYDEDEAGAYWEEEDLRDDASQHAADDEQNNVVVSGDPSAAALQAKAGAKALKDRKIASEDRTTTPYMTKYEKARILGTRALQIRYGPPHLPTQVPAA